MQLQYAILAKAAEIGEHDGLFYVLGGGIESLKSASFPFRCPVLGMLVKIRFDQSFAVTEHELRIRFLGPEQVKLADDAVVKFTPQAHGPEKKITLVAAMQMFGLEFATPGRYGFRLLVDEQELGVLPLDIEEGTPGRQS